MNEKVWELIKVHYLYEGLIRLRITKHGDWIDLRAAETVELKAGEHKLIPLGISVKLPEGYEAIIAPRSSTFENYGILAANGIGIIDNSYSGTNDQWYFSAYAIRDTLIEKNYRIAQFRIIRNQPQIIFKEEESLDENNRGGFGSTGVK